MTTLPLLPTLNKNKPQSFLRFPTSYQPNPARYSLEQHTCDAVSNKKYLYIDFQTQNKIFQLEKADQKLRQQEQAQQIGTSRIGGFQALSKMSPSGYKMHKFLSEERLYFQRKNKWKNLLKNRENSNQMDFSKIKQKINPQVIIQQQQKLQDYLQNKHNQDKWKKIQDRQQKLYDEITNQNVSQPKLQASITRAHVARRLKVRSQFRGIKLKALDKLNSLLENS